MKKHYFAYEMFSKYRGAIMGIQILLIVFFHFTEDCKGYNVRYSGIVYWFYNYVKSSGVDIFLLVSGLGLYYSWKKRAELKSFYQRRFVKILIPYFLVAVPAWIWLDLIEEHNGLVQMFSDLFFLTFFVGDNKWFWYILLCGFCYLIFPYIFDVIEKVRDHTEAKMRVLVLCLTATIVTMMLQLYAKDLYMNISIATKRVPAFIIGVYIGKLAWEKKGKPIWSVWLQLILLYWMMIPLQLYNKKIMGVYLLALMNLTICEILMLLCEWTENKSSVILKLRNGILAILNWFGKYTIEIYLIHVAFRKVFKTLDYPTYRLKYEGSMLLISFVLAVALKYLDLFIEKRVLLSLQKN